MSQLSVTCMGRWGIFTLCRKPFAVPLIHAFLCTMSKPVFNNSFIGSYTDNSREYNIDARGKDLASVLRAIDAEDITPVQEEKPADIIDSIIFTKKAKKEGMIKTIIQAFKTALSSRRDKSRALAQEVQIWQDDEYVDAQYNAQVMYDEIAKIIPLPFGYEAFKQHYNHTRK